MVVYSVATPFSVSTVIFSSGEVYILSTSNPESDQKGGRMYQLVDPSKRGNPESCNRTPSSPVVINSSTTLIPYKEPPKPG